MLSVSAAVVLLVFSVSQALGQNVTSSPNVTTSPSNSSSSNSTTTPATPTKLITKTSEQPSTPSEKSQTSSTVSLNVSPSPSSAEVPSSSVSNLTTTPTEPTTKTSEQPTTPSKKTCANVSAVCDIDWINRPPEIFLEICQLFLSALKKLFSNLEKYIDVEITELHCTKKEDKVLASAKLCLVFKKGVFIEEVFKTQVATGKLDTDLPVKNDSAEFEPLGVSFKDWKAKEGECEEKCEGAAGPFSIVKECEPDAGFSCDGLKEPTEETDDCAKYCSSTVAATVSSVILVIGIFLSSSFQ